MQREISREMELLQEDGRITQEGYARRPVWRYRRGAGVTITFSDLGYAGLMALCFVDVKHGLLLQPEDQLYARRGLDAGRGR